MTTAERARRPRRSPPRRRAHRHADATPTPTRRHGDVGEALAQHDADPHRGAQGPAAGARGVQQAGAATAKATVDRTTAKRLKLGRTRTSAPAQDHFAVGGFKVNLKLTRKARKGLKRQKRTIRMTVVVTFVPADGRPPLRAGSVRLTLSYFWAWMNSTRRLTSSGFDFRSKPAMPAFMIPSS